MKVLHFFKTYYPHSFGGIEQVIFQLAEGGRQHGVDSQVLSLCSEGAYRNKAVGNHLTHCSHRDLQIASTSFSRSVFSDFKALSEDADIIHYHFPWPFMDLVHFATRVQKPSVVSYHSDIVKQRFLLQLYKPLMYRFLDSVDSIVAASPNYLESSPVLQHYKDKVSVIPYGIDKQTYPVANPELIAHWKSKVGERFFLFVGMLRYYKGLHLLLDAAANAPYPIVIAGAGPMEAPLRKQAAKLGLGNVTFLGQVSDEDKAALLSLCYAFVFPSHLRSEAFGLSLVEASMYGKPLISCEIGTGTSFVNIHHQTGLVCAPTSVALRAGLQQLWSSPETASNMGRNAQLHYELNFTSWRMNIQHAALYRKLLS